MNGLGIVGGKLWDEIRNENSWKKGEEKMENEIETRTTNSEIPEC